MNTFNKIPRIGKAQGLFGTGKLWIQEKMDGANFRFALGEDVGVDSEFDSGLVYGSKKVEFHGWDNLNDSFEHAVEYVENNLDLEYFKDFCDWNGTLIIYGEAMHPHTMEYSDDIPDVLLFDIYLPEEDRYLDPKTAEYVFEMMDIPSVPVLERAVPVEDFAISDYEFENSRWLPDHVDEPRTEGIVIKNPVTNSRAKYRTEAFKEVHGNIKKGNVEQTDDDSEALAAKFTTEARVNKKIHEMRDEGYEIEMAMMDELWGRVYEDVINEEYDTILKGNYDINTKEFRSSVASKTASILEARLSRPEGSALNSPA